MAHGPLPVLAAQHSVGAVSGKRAGGHDLIKPALADNRGELKRTRGVIWHVCVGVRAAIGVQWSPKRWRARRPRGARQNLNSSQKGTVVQAITVRDRAAGAAGLTLSGIPRWLCSCFKPAAGRGRRRLGSAPVRTLMCTPDGIRVIPDRGRRSRYG